MLYHFLRGYSDAIFVAVHLRAPPPPPSGPFAKPPVPIEAQVATCFETLFGIASWIIRTAVRCARWGCRRVVASAARRAAAGTGDLPLALVLAAIMATVSVDARATILTFDQARSATGADVIPIQAGSNMPQDYGDRVTGSPMAVSGGEYTYGNDGEGFTPNVGVDYLADNGVSLWTIGYGDLTNVIFAGPGSNALYVQLSADPGFEVVLYGFDLAGWPLTDYIIEAVTVTGGGAVLFSQSDVPVEGDLIGPGHAAFDFTTPLMAAQLLIGIDFSNIPFGQQDNFGLDNIRFGQNPPPEIAPTQVPEPGTLSLFGIGLVLLGVLRRQAAR